MTNTLRDQLLKSGLAKAAAKKKVKPSRKRKQPKSDQDIDLAMAYKLRDKQQRKEALQSKRQRQLEDQRRRKNNQKIRALVEANKQNQADAELVRNFLYKGKIRMVRVTPKQQRQLNSGEIQIVYLTGRYYLVGAEFADQVRQISPEHVPEISAGGLEEE